MMFSIFIAVATHVAHKPIHKFWCLSTNFMLLSIAQMWPKSVANFHLTWPFCCRVFWVVNSNYRLSPSSLVLCWKDLFSLALLQWINLTILSSFSFNSLIKEIIILDVSSFILRKKLQQKSIASLIASNQNFDLPKLFSLMELVLMKRHFPQEFHIFSGIPYWDFLPGLGQGTISAILEIILQHPIVELGHSLDSIFRNMAKLTVELVQILGFFHHSWDVGEVSSRFFMSMLIHRQSLLPS